MLWFIYVVLSIKDDLTSCCGTSSTYFTDISSNITSLDSYQECSSLNALDNTVSTYESISDNFDGITSFSALSQLFLFSQINVTVASDGGCVVDHTNCLSDAVGTCLTYASDFNDTYVNSALSSECNAKLPSSDRNFFSFGLMGLALIKVVLYTLGIALKLCRGDLRPERELAHSQSVRRPTITTIIESTAGRRSSVRTVGSTASTQSDATSETDLDSLDPLDTLDSPQIGHIDSITHDDGNIANIANIADIADIADIALKAANTPKTQETQETQETHETNQAHAHALGALAAHKHQDQSDLDPKALQTQSQSPAMTQSLGPTEPEVEQSQLSLTPQFVSYTSQSTDGKDWKHKHSNTLLLHASGSTSPVGSREDVKNYEASPLRKMWRSWTRPSSSKFDGKIGGSEGNFNNTKWNRSDTQNEPAHAVQTLRLQGVQSNKSSSSRFRNKKKSVELMRRTTVEMDGHKSYYNYYLSRSKQDKQRSRETKLQTTSDWEENESFFINNVNASNAKDLIVSSDYYNMSELQLDGGNPKSWKNRLKRTKRRVCGFDACTKCSRCCGEWWDNRVAWLRSEMLIVMQASKEDYVEKSVIGKVWFVTRFVVKLLGYVVLYALKLAYYVVKVWYWIIVMVANFVISVVLFLIKTTPVLGVDLNGFCSTSQIVDDVVQYACTVGMEQCGLVRWVLLPGLEKTVLPKYFTFSLAGVGFVLNLVETGAMRSLAERRKSEKETILKAPVETEKLYTDLGVDTSH